MKEECAVSQLPRLGVFASYHRAEVSEGSAGSAGTGNSSQGAQRFKVLRLCLAFLEARECLKEILLNAVDQRPAMIPLSNVKRLFRSRLERFCLTAALRGIIRSSARLPLAIPSSPSFCHKLKEGGLMRSLALGSGCPEHVHKAVRLHRF